MVSKKNMVLVPEHILVPKHEIMIKKDAEEILKIKGFSDKFYNYMSKGFYSLATPVWTNFGNHRGLPVSCFNSLVVGWEKGLSIEGTPVVNNVNGDTLLFSNNVLTGFTNNTNTIYNAGTSGGAASTSSFYTSFCLSMNQTLHQVPLIVLLGL